MSGLSYTLDSTTCKHTRMREHSCKHARTHTHKHVHSHMLFHILLVPTHLNTFMRTLKLPIFCVYIVSGCATLHSINNGWTRRQGDTTLVTCNSTGSTYFLSCLNNRWVGNVDNCTAGELVNMVYLNKYKNW